MYKMLRLVLVFSLPVFFILTSCDSVIDQEAIEEVINIETTKYKDDVEEILTGNLATHEEESDYLWNITEAVII